MQGSLHSVSRVNCARFSAPKSRVPLVARPAQQTRTRSLPEKPNPQQSVKQQDESSVAALKGTVQLRAEKPLVLPLFLFTNLAVYGTGIAIALLVDGETSNRFFFAFAKMNDQVAAGEYYRIITATFMHAGLLHLASNSLALWYIGLEAEAVYGYYYFAAIYLLSGAAGNVASFMVDDLVTVGASGAIFGLLGAVAAYFFRNPRLERSRMQLVFLFGLVTLNIALGTVEGTLIDNTGHVAGFLSGLWLGWSTCPVWKVTPSAGSDSGSSSTMLQQAAVVIHEPSTASSLPQDAHSPATEASPALPHTPRSLDTHTSTASLDVPTIVADASVDSIASSQPEPGPASETQKSISLLDALVPESKPEEAAAPVGKDTETAAAADGADAELGSSESAVEIVTMRDGMSSSFAVSVLVSFAVSLGVLTWAGAAARLMEKGI